MMPTNRTTLREETSVVVVGAGPVGLSLALELGRRGIACIQIDQGDGVIDHPRGTGVSERTMEHFRRWGLADEIRKGYNPALPLNQVFCASMAGLRFGTAHYPPLGETPPPPGGPEAVQRCSQNWWDATLAGAVRAQPSVRLAYRQRFEGVLRNDTDGVSIMVRDLASDEVRAVQSRFLVGCDGVGSSVREALGVGRVDDTTIRYLVSILFTAPALFEQLDCEPGERFILLGPDGPGGNVTGIDGHDTWRLLVRGSDSDRFDLERFDAAAHVRAALGRDDATFEILTVRPWRIAQWVADRYRVHSVFLAGDAAHAMAPAGGFGANTGIGDAVDLSWKIDGLLTGWAGPALLDSYELERKPIAIRNANYALTNTRSWTPTGRLADAFADVPGARDLRDEIGAQLIEATRSEWESVGVSLGYRYEGSPICLDDGTPPPLEHPRLYEQSARPGSRAPHAWLADGRSTLDLFGNHFTLLRFHGVGDDSIEQAAARRGIPLRVVDIDDTRIAELYQQPLVLVRPDGHVAWRWPGPKAEADRVLDRVTGRLHALANGDT